MLIKYFIISIIICSLLVSCANQNEIPVSQQNTSYAPQQQVQQQRYPNTVAYWQDWASLRKQFNDQVRSLNTEDNSADSLQFAKLSDWLATQTLAIPQLHVDPKLTSLTSRFVALYRDRAKAARIRVELAQMKLAHKDRAEHWGTYVEAAIRGVGGDVFGVSNELKESNRRINDLQDSYNKLVDSNNTKFNDLALRRNHLRAQYNHEYAIELPE